MVDDISRKDEVTPERVAALAERDEINIPPDRIDNIAERLRDLFDLAAPLDEAGVDDFEPTKPFDARWTDEVGA
jgi:hypothetical protein